MPPLALDERTVIQPSPQKETRRPLAPVYTFYEFNPTLTAPRRLLPRARIRGRDTPDAKRQPITLDVSFHLLRALFLEYINHSENLY